MKHTKGRPPPGAQDVERWNGRTWIRDDGRPGAAFSYREAGFPMALAGECDCAWDSETCLLERAVARTYERFGAANGRRFGDYRARAA